MVVFDAELDEWRIVVDLEWSSTRGYGNMKGWVFVCELMSGRHDDEISDAEKIGRAHV